MPSILSITTVPPRTFEWTAYIYVKDAMYMFVHTKYPHTCCAIVRLARDGLPVFQRKQLNDDALIGVDIGEDFLVIRYLA